MLKLTATITLILITLPAFATPVVISETGVTISAAPYLSLVSGNPLKTINQLSKAQIKALSQNPKQLREQTLPVNTTNMTPGIVTPHTIHMPLLPNSLFIVGSGSLSQKWLALHKTQLIKLHTVGLLVQIDTASKLASMKKLAQPLQLIPVSANQIAHYLNLKHYPVLITQNQVDQ